MESYQVLLADCRWTSDPSSLRAIPEYSDESSGQDMQVCQKESIVQYRNTEGLLTRVCRDVMICLH
jgi:hypothetical protein